MIEVLTGLPGFGKTATAAKWAYNKQRQGKIVYSNLPLKGAIPYHDPLQVLGRVKNALILMDEAGILLDGLQMYNMPYEIFYELRQHRKDGVDLLMTAQSILDIAYPFRRLIQFENRITTKLGKYVQVSVKDPQPAGQVFGKRLWVLNKWVFDVYRTEFKVKPPEYLGIGAVDQEDMPTYEFMQYQNQVYAAKYLEWERARKAGGVIYGT
ncbi:hypothetical protein GC101_22025 [Paenibacillus sp. LMG 31459]|uniref:Zona occludens toxin N-terminal domain-containing protein n=1 Tax=Paenibacillus phytohabitans TaxID=2654978 RepID=A0ABX1YPG6_9BACL|nr:zonular occludens toxin domain-containing protein [Paenibacillus phytohabitans]NOU81544.1 hypothetical protein [Paenibacillus phytohabitans]